MVNLEYVTSRFFKFTNFIKFFVAAACITLDRLPPNVRRPTFRLIYSGLYGA